MTLKVVDCDEGNVLRVGEGFCVSDADKESSGQARTRGDCDGVEVAERDVGLNQSGADDGNDGT